VRLPVNARSAGREPPPKEQDAPERRRESAHEPCTARDFAARDYVATLHLHAGRHPEDPQLTELIGEPSLNSTTFRRLWADHDVLAHATGTNASTTGSSATSPSASSPSRLKLLPSQRFEPDE
jgi:hypothetical protein